MSSMRKLRRTAAAAAVATALSTVMSAEAGPRRIEAEWGTVDNEFCGDLHVAGTEPERMEVSSGHDADSVYVVFTGDGCTLSFGERADVRRIVALRFVVTGANGELCGRFSFGGGLFGTSRTVCTEDRHWLTVPVSVTAPAGPFSVTWRIEDGTARYVNAYLDYLEVA